MNNSRGRTKAIRLQHKAIFSYLRLFLLILSMFLVTIIFEGCASSPADFSDMKSLPQDEGIAFGSIIATTGGNRIKFENVFGRSTFSIIILPDDSSKTVHQHLKDDGYFYLHLSPGGYMIAHFVEDEMPLGIGYMRKWRIFAHFTVIKGKASYIGTLRIVFNGSQNNMFIEDEYDTDIIAFEKKFPGIKERAIKSLMKMEEMR